MKDRRTDSKALTLLPATSGMKRRVEGLGDQRSAASAPASAPTPTSLLVSVLGPVQVQVNGAALHLPTRKGLWLLAYLALEGAQERGVLADLLWGDVGEDQARGNLRAELYRLRQTAVAPFLELSKQQVGLPGAGCDLPDYRALLQAGRVAAAETLYRGEPLSGVGGGPTLEEWLRARREELASFRAAQLSSYARAREAQGDQRGALNTWLSLLAHDDLAEDWHREAMRLHGLLGEREQALARFERCRHLLSEGLGVQPLPQTLELAERLRSGAACARPLPVPAPAPTLDRLPLTGRDDLTGALGKLTSGLIVLLGEPGIGKTRLAEELAWARGGSSQGGPSLGGPVVLRAAEFSASTPLTPLVEPLRAALHSGLLAGLPAAVRAEVGRLLPELEPEAGREPPLAAGASSPAGRARFLQALTQALGACLGPQGPLILDDLHWFDDTTLEVCGLLLGDPQRRPLCVVTARTLELESAESARTALQAWSRRLPSVQRQLGPLSELDLLALVRTLSGTRYGELFARRLYGVTAGNPLFVLETLRGLLESGEIEVREGTWLTAYDDDPDEYAGLPMSPNVRTAVLARADRLGPEARRVLDAACLAGEVFTLRELVGATALDEWTGLSALEAAERAGLLVSSGSGHRFGHALVRRALQDALGPGRAHLLRRHLAQSLIRLGGDPASIARHLEDDPQSAAPWWRQAALSARGRYSAAAALEHLNRAVAALPAQDERRLSWLLERIKLTHALGERLQEQADLSEAGHLAYSDLERGQVLLERARFLSVAGQPGEALALAQQAAARLEGAGSARGRYEAEQCLAEMLYYQESFSRALERSQEAVRLARGLDPAALAQALNWLGIVRDTTLDPEGALAAFAEALSLLPHLGDSYMAARLHNNRATIYSLYGQFERALSDLDAALALIRQGGYRHLEGFVLDTRVGALRGLGRLDEAGSELELALEIARETGSHRLHSHCLHQRVLLLNDRQAYAATLVAAAEAFESAGSTGSTTDRIFTLTGRSEALLALGDPEGALHDASEAARLMGEADGVREGLPFFVWSAHLRALQVNDREAEAEALLGRAGGELHTLAGRLSDPEMRRSLLALPECRVLLAGESDHPGVVLPAANSRAAR
ncbi:ATP-binding protein [Deinococcus sp.]|uniref:ATP-binding protein n=1 Tax=Deinococcus sp. TaxID=47478 RepID=UPI003CC59C75